MARRPERERERDARDGQGWKPRRRPLPASAAARSPMWTRRVAASAHVYGDTAPRRRARFVAASPGARHQRTWPNSQAGGLSASNARDPGIFSFCPGVSPFSFPFSSCPLVVSKSPFDLCYHFYLVFISAIYILDFNFEMKMIVFRLTVTPRRTHACTSHITCE